MRKFDPLKYIPSADSIRKRLEEAQEEVRRLKVLLRTAEEIEREDMTSMDASSN